jgi:LTXXQ motif family protein
MLFVSARATRTAVIVIALSAAGLWALHAMDARADPPPLDDLSPCAEGRALFAAKLAYLEARISPEPSQEDAWRRFADAMRASAGEADRACAEEPPRPLPIDAGERLKRMEKHAAAMQAMFGAMANAYVAIAPNLTAAQRDILSRNIVPPPPFPSFPPPGHGSPPPARDPTLNCAGQGETGLRASRPPWGAPPF